MNIVIFLTNLFSQNYEQQFINDLQNNTDFSFGLCYNIYRKNERGKTKMKIITIDKNTGFSKRVLKKTKWVKIYLNLVNKGIAKKITENRYEFNNQIFAIMNESS